MNDEKKVDGSKVEKMLGKIRVAQLRLEDGRFGLYFDLGGKGWGVVDSPMIADSWSEQCKYPWDDYEKALANTAKRMRDLMLQAGVSEFGKLAGTPVEVVFNGGVLVSWRILSEVL